jgi:hypothetical protein
MKSLHGIPVMRKEMFIMVGRLGQTPDRLDFSSGTPDELSGIGQGQMFNFFGYKCAAFAIMLRACICARQYDNVVESISKLVSSKNSS